MSQLCQWEAFLWNRYFISYFPFYVSLHRDRLTLTNFSESFIMTIGGNVLENNANVVELTSLNRVGVGVPPCLQSLAPFPENVQFAAGGLLSRTWHKRCISILCRVLMLFDNRWHSNNLRWQRWTLFQVLLLGLQPGNRLVEPGRSDARAQERDGA